MAGHIVASFDAELKLLRSKIAEMGRVAEKQLDDSTRSLVQRDVILAQQIISEDAHLDALQRETEDLAVAIIARRQPVAVDLREIIAAIRVAGDVERIGDLAKNTAKRVLAISSELQPAKIVGSVQHMSDLVQAQLKDVLNAYSERDQEKALDVWKRDDQIDALYNSIFRELLTYMMEDTRNITFCTHLLFLAKNIERIGDHTTNIAETIYFLTTGEALTAERPKGDMTSFTTTAAL